MLRLLARPLLLAALVASSTACTGKGGATAATVKPDLDSDPFAFLPASAVFVARMDVRAMCGDPQAGADVASIADALVPIGDRASFVPSRDVDEAVIALYSTQKLDVAAVLRGRFDVDGLARAARTSNGSPIVAGVYAGFPTRTVGDVTWATLTPRTLVTGTGDGVRFVLDRLSKGLPERSLPAWAVETLQTPGAAAALVADFASQSIATASLGSINLSWLKGMRVARVIGNLQPPGLNVAATITYADAPSAEQAANAVRAADRWLDLFGPLVGGLKLQGFEANAQGSDLRSRFAVDTQGLRTLVALVPRFFAPNPR